MLRRILINFLVGVADLDPASVTVLTPRSGFGILNKFFLYPCQLTQIFFCTTGRCSKKFDIFNFVKIYGYKKVRQLICFSPSFCVVFGSEIRDGEKSGSGIKIPDPQHWCWSSKYWLVVYRAGRGSGPSTRGDGVSQHGAARRTGPY